MASSGTSVIVQRAYHPRIGEPETTAASEAPNFRGFHFPSILPACHDSHHHAAVAQRACGCGWLALQHFPVVQPISFLQVVQLLALLGGKQGCGALFQLGKRLLVHLLIEIRS